MYEIDLVKNMCNSAVLHQDLHSLLLEKGRSSLHDAVGDAVYNMAQIARISCIKEPLLKETLSLNNFGSDDRDDVYCDWIDNSEAVVDFVSCNVANDTSRKINEKI
ncbi:hypothetical protein P9112_014388 [Eukaryota sp. TZLM1-RC]